MFPRLIAAEHHRNFKREQAESGVKALDDLLGGGLDRVDQHVDPGARRLGEILFRGRAVRCGRAARGTVRLSALMSLGTLDLLDGAGPTLKTQGGKAGTRQRRLTFAEMSPGFHATYCSKSRTHRLSSLSTVSTAVPPG